MSSFSSTITLPLASARVFIFLLEQRTLNSFSILSPSPSLEIFFPIVEGKLVAMNQASEKMEFLQATASSSLL
jgi:hypothetical protein